MSVFEAQDFDHHETVAFFEDKASGLKAIIAIHSTALGPACGGTRMYPYANGDEALTDVLRLSRGMSYKSAMADLPLGGGKAVIIGHPDKDKTDARLLAYAEAVNALGGRRITAKDVGIGPQDAPGIARRFQAYPASATEIIAVISSGRLDETYFYGMRFHLGFRDRSYR